MKKLLNAYRAAPTLSNRVKLQSYLNRHLMAVCLASRADIAFLKANYFNI